MVARPGFLVSVTLQGPKDYVSSSKNLKNLVFTVLFTKNVKKICIEFGTNFRPLQILQYSPLIFETHLCKRYVQYALFSENYSSIGPRSLKICPSEVELLSPSAR